jgi:PadR family transcriptional regulator PadR
MTRRRALSAQARHLIATLIEEPQLWQYGYELSKRTGVKAGTLYPLLIRLCEQGVLEATWREADQLGRPPRHLYRLTPQGVEVGRETADRAARPSSAVFDSMKTVS